MKQIERLNELALIGLEYYNKDPRNEFKDTPVLNARYTRTHRLSLIQALKEFIEELPLDITEDVGFGTVQLDVEKMSDAQRNIIKYITLELNTKVLRGTESGYKLKTTDLPYINKWNPLVMSVLMNKHNLKERDFIVRNNNGKHLLGKDLKDLLVHIQYRETSYVNVAARYYLSETGNIIKDELLNPDSSLREEVTDEDEDRINYNARGNQIIRNWSPWTLTFLDEYTNEYKLLDPKLKLSKKYMSNLVNGGIMNKPKKLIIPEGCGF